MNDLYFYKIASKTWVDGKKLSILKRLFWKSFSKGKYVGEIKDGLPHGQGKLYYVHGGRYFGSWNDGKRHGIGTYKYSDGRVSFGMYYKGKKNGKMTIKCPNGDTYEGIFKEGQPLGKFNFTDSLGMKSEVFLTRAENPLKSS